MPNHPTPRTIAFTGWALVIALAFGVVYGVSVRTRAGQLLDEQALVGAEWGQRRLAPFTLGILHTVPVASVAVGLILAILVTAFRHNWRVLIVAIGAALAANIATEVLKYFVLPRPDLNVHGYAFNSLPSGHTTLPASAVLVVFLVSSPRLRPLVAALGTLLAVMAGASTLANQWHRPSDVIAAFLVVAFFGCLAGAVLTRVRSPRTSPVKSRWNPVMLCVALPCLVIAGVALVAAVRLSDSASPGSAGPVGLPLAYIGGVAGVIAVGFLLAVAANRAFRSLP